MASVPHPRPLVAGNWKMNGTRASLDEVRAIATAASMYAADMMICPPATLVAATVEAAHGTSLLVGGQDCHALDHGAHTGSISAAMLRDCGAHAVIVGHSERRTDHLETNAQVRAKAEAAHRAQILAIVCIGETAAERKSGATLDVIADQLSGSVPDGAAPDNTVLAYEPVWAIGTGLTPTPVDIEIVHAAIRKALVVRFGARGQLFRLLYGGSVKAANAGALMAVANVNGALVGGASLKAVDFLGIMSAYAR
jgi:triosephosphate isomerase (TIM)